MQGFICEYLFFKQSWCKIIQYPLPGWPFVSSILCFMVNHINSKPTRSTKAAHPAKFINVIQHCRICLPAPHDKPAIALNCLFWLIRNVI